MRAPGSDLGFRHPKPMLYRLLKELGITALICLGERVLERLLFPGLHRMPGHMAAADPARADDLSTLIAETLALFALVWLFNGTLYAVGYLKRLPLKPLVPTAVAVVISLLTFAGAYAQWASLPTPPAG
jgi:hypothetical protein